MADHEPTIKIRRPARIQSDGRGRSVWTDPVETSDELELVSTQALHLSPGAPENYISLHDIGNGHFASGRYEQAVTWEQRSISVNPGYFFSHLVLAAAYAHLGRLAEARAEVDAALALRPGLTLASISKHPVHHFPERRRRWVDGLLKAGLPER